MAEFGSCTTDCDGVGCGSTVVALSQHRVCDAGQAGTSADDIASPLPELLGIDAASRRRDACVAC